MSAQPCLIGEGWVEVLDGDPTVRALFDRHYSRQRRRDGSTSVLMIGPGEKYLMARADARAVCCWRVTRMRADNQDGVECCIFRREGGGRCSIFRREGGDLASDMLLEAMALVDQRWPGRRLFTFVDPRAVQPTLVRNHPTWGWVFVKAGWRFCGWTAKRKLMIFESLPAWRAQRRAA